MPRQPLGDVARVQLGAAVDIGPVPLDDDPELHGATDEILSRARRVLV